MVTYQLTIQVSRQVWVLSPDLGKSSSMDREQFYHWLWKAFADPETQQGLVGVHEGTLLSEDATRQGFETDSWTVDSGEAPRERDWIAQQERAHVELYFSDEAEANAAAVELKRWHGVEIIGPVRKQEPQDWDAEWKAAFLNNGEGVPIQPFWRIVPAWFESSGSGQEKLIRINPGAGFGTGTHETTQLCLQAIGDVTQELHLNGKKSLDFGSGSGILAIAMALLGAKVDAVEVDSLAIDNSLENALLNGVKDRISFSQVLGEEDFPYPLIVANILKPVLLEFSKVLVGRLEVGGRLILSGLIEKDVAPVVSCYAELLGRQPSRILERGEWRAVVF
jgi:ribosomal protein L11 methyltransferase